MSGAWGWLASAAACSPKHVQCRINVFGLMRVSRAVQPIMRQQKGSTIINFTSMAGIFGLALTSVYLSCKFAAEGLSEAMALEYKPLNIHVKTIAFGTSFSANTDNNLENGDAININRSASPLTLGKQPRNLNRNRWR